MRPLVAATRGASSAVAGGRFNNPRRLSLQSLLLPQPLPVPPLLPHTLLLVPPPSLLLPLPPSLLLPLPPSLLILPLLQAAPAHPPPLLMACHTLH